jgi:undecaprenyl-diphosphatase
MSLIEAIILGAIQGITEFLPVSSSGHLVLLQRIFGISEPVLFFDTMVHVGTLAAVFVVLRNDIWAILKKIIQPMTAFLIIGTIPAVIAALILKDRIESAFESGIFLGAAFLFTAAALIVSELLSQRPHRDQKVVGSRTMTWLDALIIGICQAVAIVPGVSRSGLTLSGALSRKLDRDYAARFSFLLSIPAILGALLLQVKDLVQGEAVSGGIGAVPVIAGTVTAAIVGFFAVTFMLRIVRERSLVGFAVYVGILGVLVFADQFVTHLFF